MTDTRPARREWYGYHFPELVRIVADNLLYAKLVLLIKRRSALTDASQPALEETLMNSAQAQQVLDAAKASMGMEISDIDLVNINAFASRVVSLTNVRAELAWRCCGFFIAFFYLSLRPDHPPDTNRSTASRCTSTCPSA